MSEALVEARIRKMLEPIAASQKRNSTGSEQLANAAMLDVAVVALSSLVIAAESLQTIARVLEADAKAEELLKA